MAWSISQSPRPKASAGSRLVIGMAVPTRRVSDSSKGGNVEVVSESELVVVDPSVVVVVSGAVGLGVDGPVQLHEKASNTTSHRVYRMSWRVPRRKSNETLPWGFVAPALGKKHG